MPVQVLITLHVTTACAACKYVGKAHGFEYAQSLPDAPGVLACIDPKAVGAAPTALLLALEPYTVDVVAARAALVDTGLDDAESATTTQKAVMARVEKGYTAQKCAAACQSMNLWQYLMWLQDHEVQLTIYEIAALALQLVTALHSLHHDAHVRSALWACIFPCIHHAVARQVPVWAT